MVARRTPRDEALLRSMVLLHRYSADITAIASDTLGGDQADNRAIQLLLLITERPGVTPSELADLTAMSKSAVSRSVGRLSMLGLVSRRRGPADRRSVTLRLTAKGRRNVEQFAWRLSDYFEVGAPLVKEALHELGMRTTTDTRASAPDPVRAAMAMSAAGAEYTEDAIESLRRFEVSQTPERWSLTLLYVQGSARPSEFADEFGLTSGTVSTLLDRLEDRGLIVREYGKVPGDRRAVLAHLSRNGEAAARELLKVFARHAEAVLRSMADTVR